MLAFKLGKLDTCGKLQMTAKVSIQEWIKIGRGNLPENMEIE